MKVKGEVLRSLAERADVPQLRLRRMGGHDMEGYGKKGVITSYLSVYGPAMEAGGASGKLRRIFRSGRGSQCISEFFLRDGWMSISQSFPW
ncbi:MAG: hypothetical protein RMJ57_03990 [Bacteroidia bacterium]|nr:hypothetical protein [Bacteroidia bacterium]